MTILLALLPDCGHDQLWLLIAAQRMGPHFNPYGPTVFESNPPLVLWLSALVVALARLLHLSLTVTFKLAVCLLATTSAVVSAKLLPGERRHSGEARISVFALPRPNPWPLAIAFILIFGAIPARDFGQRDHILTLLILPYLILAATRSSSLTLRTAVTLTAALGIALKPHQSLIPITIELLLLTQTLRVPHNSRLRLLEPTLFLLAALTYLAAIHTFAPTYLTQILPTLRETYWAFGSLTVLQLACSAIELLLLAAISLYICRRPADPAVPILLTAASAATVAYFLQGTGWYYQQLPAISLFSLALTMQLLTPRPNPVILSEVPLAVGEERSRRTPRLSASLQNSTPLSQNWLPWTAAALTLLTLTLTTCFSDFHLAPRGRFPQDLQQPQPIPDPTFFTALPPGAPVATLTTSVDDTAPPAFRYHLTLAQRYPHLWMLPAILRDQSGPTPTHPIRPAELEHLDRLQHQFMVEDLQRWHPTLILVERCEDPQVHCQVLEDRHDNLLAWFLRDPAFAQIFAHYRLLRTSGPYAAYTLSP
jgi:hypothetical protein